MDFFLPYPFAILMVNGARWPVTALTPLVLSESDDELIGHVSRANPFWQAAQTSGHMTALFRGPQAYVSASLYPSKQEHGREVPTWNYLCVEVAGAVSVETSPAMMRPYLEVLTTHMEADRQDPWAVSDAPADYIDSLQRGITGLRLRMEHVRMVRKLSQNKAERERAAVRSAFLNSLNPDEAALGAAMQPE